MYVSQIYPNRLNSLRFKSMYVFMLLDGSSLEKSYRFCPLTRGCFFFAARERRRKLTVIPLVSMHTAFFSATPRVAGGNCREELVVAGQNLQILRLSERDNSLTHLQHQVLFGWKNDMFDICHKILRQGLTWISMLV